MFASLLSCKAPELSTANYPDSFSVATSLRQRLRVSGTSYWIQSRQTFPKRRQRRKGHVRLRLIPIRDREVVVRANVGVPVLNGRAERFRKRNRRIQMKSVHR